SRDNSRRFLKTAGIKGSYTEYSDPEYSDSELLVYEFENNYKEDFNNKETELNKEKLPYYSSGSKCTQQCKNKGLKKIAQGSMSLNNFFKPVKKLEIESKMLDSNISNSDIGNNTLFLGQINKLNNKLKNMKNMNAYEYLCYLAVHKYLTAIFNHEEPYSYIDLSYKILQQ
ncbi:44318_t:CDS:2, partial [Gigaspora margarita]